MEFKSISCFKLFVESDPTFIFVSTIDFSLLKLNAAIAITIISEIEVIVILFISQVYFCKILLNEQ